MVNLVSVNEKINGHLSHQITEQARNFDLFREEAIYLFAINVYQGVGMRRIEWEHLGLKSETINTLKKNKASTPSLTVFSGLKDKASQLNSMKAKIQRRFMVYAQPYWFIRECDLEKAADEIQEMREEFSKMQDELVIDYDNERDSFLLKVGQILQSAGVEGTELENALSHYLCYFPSKEKVIADFRLEFTGPIRVPSMREQTEQDAILAENQNRLNEANIIQQLQMEYTHNIRSKFSEAVGEAKDEIYGILAEQLGKLETIGTDEVNNRTQKTLQKAINRMSVLTGYDEGLQSIAQNFGAIVSSAKNLDQRSEMFNKISDLRKKLSDEISLISHEGKGHKALAQWMM